MVLSFRLFGITWLRYLIAICVNVSISRWILEVMMWILQVLNGCIMYGSFDLDGDDDGWEYCPT